MLNLANDVTPKPNELKNIKSRVGDGKVRRELEDIINVYAVLDANKVQLPRFLAADSDRVPTFKDIDVCKFSATLMDIVDKIDVLSCSMKKITDRTTSQSTAQVSTTAPSCVLLPDPEQSGGLGLDESVNINKGWSVIVNGRPVSADLVPSFASRVLSSQPIPIKPVGRKIVGARSDSSTKIAATPAASKFWHIFVGRVDKDTEELAIKEFLEGNGIIVAEVRKLKATKDWQANSSAFRVSVAFSCKDSVMSSDLWPENVVVRDWFFKPK